MTRAISKDMKMAREKLWTVVRFPDGTWSYGGSIDSPDYEHCEKWRTFAIDGKTAVRKTQRKSYNERRREERDKNERIRNLLRHLNESD